jgi:Na+/phosphate symporter
MLIQCFKASITKSAYNKVYLQRVKYIILRKNTFEQVEDGVCFLKTIIDKYHSNTRSSTKQTRKQLATLNHYMRAIAKGDVSNLCEHTRELRDEQRSIRRDYNSSWKAWLMRRRSDEETTMDSDTIIMLLKNLTSKISKQQRSRNSKHNKGIRNRISKVNCLREPPYHPVLDKKRKPSNSQHCEETSALAVE